MRKYLYWAFALLFILGVVTIGALWASAELAKRETPGVVTGSAPRDEIRVTKIVDGDTFIFDASRWSPSPDLVWKVRVAGIDTPEKEGRAECASEARRAALASALTKKLIEDSGMTVRWSNIEHDKYGGRLDADIILDDGRSLADVLISEGLARRYSGGRKSSWCPV